MALVLFSGGCDSTLVLYQLLQNQDIRENVKTLSILHPQVGAQEPQKRARENIFKEFQARELPTLRQKIEFEYKFEESMSSPGEGGITQPLLWLPIAFMFAEAGEKIYAGYHKGDDFFKFHDRSLALLDAMCEMHNRKVYMEFPLEYMRKSDIIQELKDRRLYEFCWYCEFPEENGGACKKCYPCITHRAAVIESHLEKKLNPRKHNFSKSVFKEALLLKDAISVHN